MCHRACQDVKHGKQNNENLSSSKFSSKFSSKNDPKSYIVCFT